MPFFCKNPPVVSGGIIEHPSTKKFIEIERTFCIHGQNKNIFILILSNNNQKPLQMQIDSFFVFVSFSSQSNPILIFVCSVFQLFLAPSSMVPMYVNSTYLGTRAFSENFDCTKLVLGERTVRVTKSFTKFVHLISLKRLLHMENCVYYHSYK